MTGPRPGTLGYDPPMSQLLGYRTEPIRVPLNVAQRVEDTGALLPLYELGDSFPQDEKCDQAYTALWSRYHEPTSAMPRRSTTRPRRTRSPLKGWPWNRRWGSRPPCACPSRW